MLLSLLLPFPFLTMWNTLPYDVLSHIFSYLPPQSLALAMSSCHHWYHCVKSTDIPATRRHHHHHHHHPPWFLALSTRSRNQSCFLLNPIDQKWHLFPNIIPSPSRPIATIGGLIILKSTSHKHLQLAICNPFTKQFKRLPFLQIGRANPAVGLIELGPGPITGPTDHFRPPHFRVYAAGGMSEQTIGCASYEPTLEMYDSKHDTWTMIGPMPVEFAVRLTVWTPNESVYSNGILYWITSARSYSIMGFEIGPSKWKELSVPMGDRLELATLVPWNGKLGLVGVESGGDVNIWELGDNEEWMEIERMSLKLTMNLSGGKNVKCIGIEGAVCLYKDLWNGMVVWKEVEKGRWEWSWIPGCNTMENCPIKGMLLHPNLSPSFLLDL